MTGDYLAMGDNALSDIQSRQSRQASRRGDSKMGAENNAGLNLDLLGLKKLPPQKGNRHRRY